MTDRGTSAPPLLLRIYGFSCAACIGVRAKSALERAGLNASRAQGIHDNRAVREPDLQQDMKPLPLLEPHTLPSPNQRAAFLKESSLG